MTTRTLSMQLNTFFSGPQAWFFLAEANGYLREEGLALAFVEGDTAANTIPKMADGGIDVGYGDLNALIEHLAHGKPNPPLAVFASYNASPYTIAVARGSAIVGPKDLRGKRLLAHPNDAALNLFAEFCARTGLDMAQVNIELSTAPHSALVPALLAGGFDGLFGFVNTLVAASLDAGLAAPREHLRFLEYHDHVPELYGMALMVMPALAAREPNVVSRLLRALNRGLVDTVADPAAAIAALQGQHPGVTFDSNLRRLQGTLALEMGRREGASLGIGDLDDARLQRGIDLIVDTKRLGIRPTAAQVFDRQFLPPLAHRVRNLYPPSPIDQQTDYIFTPAPLTVGASTAT